MAMTKGGSIKHKAAMIAKFGSYDNWCKHLRKIGAKGGKAGVGHQFAHGMLDPSKTGKLGGKPSHDKVVK
jgi:general stress protein YciG